MRTLLLISVVATLAGLAACDDAQSTTAPTRARTVAAPAGQASIDIPTNQGKPAAGGLTVVVVTSNEVSTPGGAIAASVSCPAGTTRTGGGYVFTSEGNWVGLPTVTQNMPIANGWWVRVVNEAVGHGWTAFKVYALCAS